MNGARIEPRTNRTYTLHQDYLGLFTFRFALPSLEAVTESELHKAIEELGKTTVAFRVSEPRRSAPKSKRKKGIRGPRAPLRVSTLRDSGQNLAHLHADSRSAERQEKGPRSHVEAMPPVVFVHDVDACVSGWEDGVWVRCRRVGSCNVFLLRKTPTVTTQRMQSYIAAHLMEGFAVREMAAYVQSRGRAFGGRAQLYVAQRAIGRAATARKAAQSIRQEVRRSIDMAVGSSSECAQLNREFDLGVQILQDLKNREVAELLTSVAQGT